MSYATYADLIAALDEPTVIQLSDDNGDGIADIDVYTQAIADADNEINALICIRYAIPLNPAPALAVSLSARMAVYHLFGHRGAGVPQDVSDRYTAAGRLLKLIGAGTAGWGESVLPATNEVQVDVRFESAERTFRRSGMKDY